LRYKLLSPLVFKRQLKLLFKVTVPHVSQGFARGLEGDIAFDAPDIGGDFVPTDEVVQVQTLELV
jgi:hypothetical protein